jgi:hypothetical protein
MIGLPTQREVTMKVLMRSRDDCLLVRHLKHFIQSPLLVVTGDSYDLFVLGGCHTSKLCFSFVTDFSSFLHWQQTFQNLVNWTVFRILV